MLTIKNAMIVAAILYGGCEVSAQRQITAIVTSSTTQSPVTYNNVKGAGLRTAANVLSSNWDSTGSNFTLNFNQVANNVTSITQFTASGMTNPFISWPVNAYVKVRRAQNGYVTDSSQHFNFWARYSSIPASGAVSGSYIFQSPEIVSPDDAFVSNNINSGYDNIFQNTINNLHSGNIERIDFIIPNGLRPQAYDINGSGAVVFDRGSGDPFKVAVILSLDNNGTPLTYGPLLSATAASFGPDLLPIAHNYCILTKDPKFGIRPRPSTMQTQNIRGLLFTLGDLGIVAGQRFYGYSIFGQDVLTASADWTTYPNTSNAASQLDPVNVMTIFKDVNSLLPISMSFKIIKRAQDAILSFNIYDAVSNKEAIIERSLNGKDFSAIGKVEITRNGEYRYNDQVKEKGKFFYRIRLVDRIGNSDVSEVKSIVFEDISSISISPNPVKNQITIELPISWQKQKMNASVYNSAGIKIMQHFYTSSSAVQSLSLKRITAGAYFLHLTNENTNEIIVRPVLKIE